MAFEVGEALLPELPILFRPARNVLDPVGLELIDALPPLLSLADETRSAQYASLVIGTCAFCRVVALGPPSLVAPKPAIVPSTPGFQIARLAAPATLTGAFVELRDSVRIEMS